MPHWNTLPYEVQEHIVVCLLNNPDILNPPSDLLSILLLSRNVHDSLVGAPPRGSPVNNALFARLFKTRFDTSAPTRRLARGGMHTAEIFAKVFKHRCKLLRDIRSGELLRIIQGGQWQQADFERALWEVLLMLLEDDYKNRAQLEHAGVEEWLKTIVVTFAQVMDDDGWPQDSLILQLAAASFAIVSDRASVLRDGQLVGAEIGRILQPIFLAGHRYPHAHIPITRLRSYDVRPVSVPANSLRTMDTMPIIAPQKITYFGRLVTLSPPPLFSSVALLITNRSEIINSWFSPNLPVDRAAADAIDRSGATQKDWLEYNLIRRQAIGIETPRVGSDNENLACLDNPARGSERWDALFNRMYYVTHSLLGQISHSLSFTWFETVYKPGTFTGTWFGRVVFPDWRMYTRMLEMHPAPLSDVYDTLRDEELGVYSSAFHVTLYEHITTDFVVGDGEETLGYGVQNGYFAAEIDPRAGKGMRNTGTSLLVQDSRDDPEWSIKTYTTWYEGMELPDAQPPPPFPLAAPRANTCVPEDIEMEFSRAGVSQDDEEDDEDDEDVGDDVRPFFDVIVTGETDYVHGKAWGAYMLYGRVRKLDGLLVLVRTPQDPSPDSGLGRWIFSGYIHMADTIVGRWRETGTDMQAAGFQGPFILSKIGPTWGLPAQT